MRTRKLLPAVPVTLLGMSACTSILGSFDFTGKPGGSGGGGGAANTNASSSSSQSSTSSASGGGMGGGASATSSSSSGAPASSSAGSGGVGGASTSSSSSSSSSGADMCNDGKKDDGETGVDCGGGVCAACPAGQGCQQPSDCQSMVCSGNAVCLAPTCSDGVKNGNETDVDCGGGTCPACPDGKMCGAASDCTSSVCTGGTCQAPTCSDGVKNGNETDIDCGGGTCPVCAFEKDCKAGTDCVTGFCVNMVCDAQTVATQAGALPGCIATDGTSVFWGTQTGVWRVAVTGGAITQLASGSCTSAYGMAIDAANVYWADPSLGGIHKVPQGGGTAVTLNSASEPEDVAVDSTYVYWTSSTLGTVMRVPIAGGSAATLATSQPNPYAIFASNGTATWVVQGTVGNDTEVMTYSGGVVSRLFSTAAAPYGGGSIAAGLFGSVFWSDGNGTIWNGASMFATGQILLGAIVVATSGGLENVVAWIEGGQIKESKAGSIITLVQGYEPIGIATDNTYVYWTDNDASGVRRAKLQ